MEAMHKAKFVKLHVYIRGEMSLRRIGRSGLSGFVKAVHMRTEVSSYSGLSTVMVNAERK